MLAKSASDQWQKDPESEIFVDMDKIVRKVKVEDAILAKESILDRLEETVKSFSIQHIRLQESAKQSAIKNRCAEIALFCCRGALRERKSCDGGWQIKAGDNNTYTENGGKECYGNVMEVNTTNSQVLMDVNHFLKDYGLELWKFDRSGSVVTFDIKEVDQHLIL